MSNVIDPQNLTKKDFATDQDVRWCPGCGDYSILANVQKFMPELGLPLDQIVWVSGIGCSSRFPYYMNTYGFHTIHGRAPAVATGIKAANPELSVWLATGDGDGLSIGGNHLLHCLRRNVDIKLILFNNRIYGLTKGQYSPTSETGKVTKSTPLGSADQPLDPSAFAFGANASFVARAIDVEANLMGDVLTAAGKHSGSAFIEVYQNCNVFNDGAFDAFREKVNRHRLLYVKHGEPLRFGKDNEQALRLNPATMALEVAVVGENGVSEKDILVHDETNPVLGYMLARMPFPEFPVAVGVLHKLPRPTYHDALISQRKTARERYGDGDLKALLNSGSTWTV